MTPRKFTEVALKILGVYSVIEGVGKIAWSTSFYGVVGLFSKIENSISDLLISSIFLAIGGIFLRYSARILNIIFDRGEPFSPSHDRHFREWHISILAVCGGFLMVTATPLHLSIALANLKALLREPIPYQGYPRDTLWAHFFWDGGFTLIEAGILIWLLFGAKGLTEYIFKLQDPHRT